MFIPTMEWRTSLTEIDPHGKLFKGSIWLKKEKQVNNSNVYSMVLVVWILKA